VLKPDPMTAEFYKARGFKKIGNEYVITLKHTCPHLLDNNLCGIHNTKKPVFCKVYPEKLKKHFKSFVPKHCIFKNG